MSDNINLPPKGHQRNEQMRRNADALEEKAAFLETKLELHGFDPEKIKPENEIVQHLDMRTFEFQFEGALPEYHYFWCGRRREQIDEAKSRARYWYSQRGQQAPVQGYEMVHNGMPEWDANKILQHADGGLVIGDLVLMRMKREVYEQVEKNIQMFKAQRQGGIMSGVGQLADLADKLGGRVSAHSFQNQTPQQFYAGRGRRLVHTGNFND